LPLLGGRLADVSVAARPLSLRNDRSSAISSEARASILRRRLAFICFILVFTDVAMASS
jgi:hypothetical protein